MAKKNYQTSDKEDLEQIKLELAEKKKELLELRRINYELQREKDQIDIRLKFATQGLEASNKELEDFKNQLEQKVEERTKELQGKIVELERFQRITISRELKMAELKEEIKKLKKVET